MAAQPALGLACLIGVVFALLVGATGARAAITHQYLSQITEVPAGPGVQLAGPISTPRAMTVDRGHLWVAEQISGEKGGFRIDEFEAASGAFLAQFPQGTNLNYPVYGIGVSHATGSGRVYVGAQQGSETLVAVFDEAGTLLETWDGAQTPGMKAFGQGLVEVAVDNSSSPTDPDAGDVYVADDAENEGVIDVFKPQAGGGEQLIGQITEANGLPLKLGAVAHITIDPENGDVLITNKNRTAEEAQELDVFEPDQLGGYVFMRSIPALDGQTTDGPEDVAVDGGTGDIYEAVAESGVIYEFDANGAYLGRILGDTTPAGNLRKPLSIAVDPISHDLYVGDYREGSGSGGEPEAGVVDLFGPNVVIPDVTSESPSAIGDSSAVFHGSVNPDGAGEASCRFLWGTTKAFGQVAPCSGVVPNGTGPVPVEATVSGLQPDTTYFYRLEASNESGKNPGEEDQDQELVTIGPGLHGESVSNVASSSASVDATIDPHGLSTAYYFEYGIDTGYGSTTPGAPAAIGAGNVDVEVTQHIQGLTPSTLYHYRVVVVSELEPGVFESFREPDQTFTTQSTATSVSVLADGRTWEQVSAVDKRGAQIYSIGEQSDEGAVIQAAASGDAITYVSDSPTEAFPDGYTNLQQLFSGRGPDGWVSHDIALPHDDSTGVSLGYGQEYRFFAEDLSSAIVQPFGKFIPSLSREASEPTAYMRSVYGSNGPTTLCTSSCFHPLVTGAPGYANVPSGTAFGQELEGKCESARGKVLCGPQFEGSTADLSHVVLTSTVALTEDPAPDGGLYEWSGGALAPVSVLPGPSGEVVPANLGTLPNARNAISDDGSRVVWSSQGSLYVRDVPRKETLLIGHAEFENATEDGTKLFFVQIANGKSVPEECEIKVSVATGELECLAQPSGGEVIGMSRDGAWRYLLSGEVLAPGGVSGARNIYLDHDGAVRFIASVSTVDAQHLVGNELTHMTSRVSPDGQWFAFMSEEGLAGASTKDVASGRSDEEVYLYDAAGDGGAGRLACVSCNPTGARPAGVEYPSDVTPWSGGSVWGNQWLASNIPGGTPYSLNTSLYSSRVLRDDGRMFFNSNDALVPQDVNGTWDVYEWEPPGVGSCTTANASYGDRSGGCVSLVSSGESSEESGFLDASATGGDVFFLTSAKLVKQDTDTALDVYDAHECTDGAPCFASQPAAPPPCDTGDSCKSAPSPQPGVFGSPASATFSGAGNAVAPAQPMVVTRKKKRLTRAQKLARALKTCRKQHAAKRRKRCIRQAKARYSAAGTAGRTGRGVR